uniref:Suppressor APC domain-containing protein n=1 Tax=Ciona savignyi TaxID=51511 RepID=H2YCC9_CIOSA
PVSGLPKQFVNSMKTLFNILDDNGIGLVPLTEIERRWRDDAVPNLPGVLDCLRSVAPPDGLLSFETFVWGLRTALSRARHDKVKFKDATNRKTSSKQDLDSDTGILPPYYYRDIGKGKASRYQSKTASDNEGSYVKQSSRSNWLEDNDVTFGRYPVNTFSGIPQPQNHPDNRSFKSGHRRSKSEDETSLLKIRRHGGSKKREPRRHTVTNGIDYNVLKLIKQLEQEKDVLLQGLETLNRGRQWFQDRICDVQEKQRLLSNNGLKPTSDVTENDATATQARIDGLLTKVSDMTKFVQSMSDDNTETVNFDNFYKQSRVVTALREQNHILTQDVTQKSDKIVQLEHEKSVLVQQLFQAKAEAQCVDGQVNTSIFI